MGGPSCGQPIDAATLSRCLPRVPRLLSGVRMPPRWCPIRRRFWSLGRVSGSRQEEAQHWPKERVWRDFWRWSLKFRIRYPNTGARVGVGITFSPPVCLCRPTLEGCGAYAIHQHRGVVKHVAMANTTPFARRSPRRRLERHEEYGTHCGLRDGLVPPALQKAISPCQDVGVDSMSPCAPVSQPNPHDSANAPSHDGRHSCRGGDIGCPRRRCHRRCRRALDMS